MRTFRKDKIEKVKGTNYDFYQKTIAFESWEETCHKSCNVKKITIFFNKHWLRNGTKRCIYILVCKQKNMFIEWKFSIHLECWTIFIAFQMKKNPEKEHFFWYLRYGEDDWKKTKFTARFSLNLRSMPPSPPALFYTFLKQMWWNKAKIE